MALTMSAVLLKDKQSNAFEEKWSEMRPTILKLLHQETVPHTEWQNLFFCVHQVCIWDEKGSAKIYIALQNDILQYINAAQKRVLSHYDDQALLRAYIHEWNSFFAQCMYLPLPFNSLEPGSNKSIPVPGHRRNTSSSVNEVQGTSVGNLMLETWNASIFANVKERLQTAAMKILHAERTGEPFDSQLVIGVRESYVNLCSDPCDKLKIYSENFEKAYIDATREFYASKAPTMLAEIGVRDYMTWALSKLQEEEKRGQKYLENCAASHNALSECCVSVLVTSFKDSILAECDEMIKQNDTEKLRQMFQLMDRVPNGIEPMLASLEQHIVLKGLADMHASANVITSDSEKYVEALLDLFNQFSTLVQETFDDNARFMTTRDKAFKRLVNDTSVFKLELPLLRPRVGPGRLPPESKCPELLANYCDMLLRKTSLSKRLTSEQIEKKLKDVLLLLKYVDNKDVFMQLHKVHLSRRLLLDASSDDELEESMVEWLRRVGMPADYVNKLARMFQDIKVSGDLNEKFRVQRSNTAKAESGDTKDINIKILNAGAWFGAGDRISVTLPHELEDYVPEVEKFYMERHHGRKLNWYHHASNGTITFRNAMGTYDLDVTTFQMAVLFAWNQRRGDRLSFEDLRLATELPEFELRKTLWTLVAQPPNRPKVLAYHPEVQTPRDFTAASEFWLNEEFAIHKNGKVQPRGRVSLVGRLQLGSDRPAEEDNAEIVLLREMRTQEAISTIMKTRKRLNLTQLETELVQILRNQFIPSRKLMKEQIEWMIDREHLKRDPSDMNVFIYQA
ncbi:unnamed protein product [Cyprideis torosa]|uniref:Cullin-5 n=1 Tax=Cyprideis torosa TaxID=163714 RepID=A0A7R8WBE0_9CRUS|nr:unnamed protein product [Cyprideis torosa]CAG0886196.1 unnamed protein product [Cyprideis torosa]